jgi:hypothetical protein
MGEEEHAVPWSKLTYDTILGGYRTDITEDQLRRRACILSRSELGLGRPQSRGRVT